MSNGAESLLIERFSRFEGAEGVREFAARELEECRRELRDIVGVDDGSAGVPRGRANTLEPLNDLTIRLGNLSHVLGVVRHVHPDREVRSACETAEQAAARFASELRLHRGLYDAVVQCQQEELDATARRLREHLLRDFRRAGVDRDDATRERIRVLRHELVELGQEFTRNIADGTREIELDDAAELDGLPDDYVRDHPPDERGKIRITTDYPDYNPFMVYANDDRRRQELFVAFRLRGHPRNLEVLDSILARRHELAQLLGYDSWASYVSEDKMIRTPEAISSFIERVSEIAEPVARSEYDALLDEKRRDHRGGDATEVLEWERGWLEERVRARRFRAERKELRAYFEYERVKNGLLALTESLFDIRFVPAPDAARWHPDIEVLDVAEDGRRVGRVYLDMHPRAGKFKHAAMFPVANGVRGKQVPEVALVCNFPDPRASCGPALLEHDDVVTFFHEFGHLIHHLFARDLEWVEFSGVSTEWDFVEVPSQLYEELAWEHDVLAGFAAHHATGDPIPEELVARLRRSRVFGQGLWARQQMLYAAVSYRCHATDPARLDVGRLMVDLQERYSLFRFVEGTHFQAGFGHLDDYSALYYTYMWSLVIEKDFLRLLGERSFDRAAAQRYRECVLSPGGSKDAVDLVRDFLGRDFSFEAFETWLARGTTEPKPVDA